MSAEEILINKAYETLGEEGKRFNNFLSTFIIKYSLKDKVIHFNWHLDDVSLLVIAQLLKAGAKVTVSTIGELVARSSAIEALKQTGIEYIDSEEKLPKTCDIYFDCNAGLLNKIKPECYGIELTHTDPQLYEDIDYAILNLDSSHSKLVETMGGTGDGFCRGLEAELKNSALLPNKKYWIFGCGKVGTGIRNALLERGVPASHISMVDTRDIARREVMSKGVNTYYLNKDDPQSIEKIKAALEKEEAYVIGATGRKDSIGKYFSFESVKFKPETRFANMSTEDDFGETYPTEKFIAQKRGIFNFEMLERPTLLQFLAPSFALALAAAIRWNDLICCGTFFGMGEDDDQKVLNQWKTEYGIDYREFLSHSVFNQVIKKSSPETARKTERSKSVVPPDVPLDIEAKPCRNALTPTLVDKGKIVFYSPVTYIDPNINNKENSYQNTPCMTLSRDSKTD